MIEYRIRKLGICYEGGAGRWIQVRDMWEKKRPTYRIYATLSRTRYHDMINGWDKDWCCFWKVYWYCSHEGRSSCDRLYTLLHEVVHHLRMSTGIHTRHSSPSVLNGVIQTLASIMPSQCHDAPKNRFFSHQVGLMCKTVPGGSGHASCKLKPCGRHWGVIPVAWCGSTFRRHPQYYKWRCWTAAISRGPKNIVGVGP